MIKIIKKPKCMLYILAHRVEYYLVIIAEKNADIKL